MSLTLLIALAASVAFAGLCWLCALGVDRLAAGVRLRVAVWTMALCLPVLLVACALMVGALNLRSPLADLRTHLQPASITSQHHGSPSAPWIEIALAMLAVGAVGRLGGLWIAGLRVARAVEQSLPVDSPLFSGVAPVRETDCTTPVLAGFRRPVILMPRRLIAALPAEQVALICAHEQSHLAAGDHFAHILEEIAVRVFWFNLPLMAIRRRLTAAREEACDARVLASCDDHTRRVYAQCLLFAFRVAGDEMAVMAFTGHGNDEAKRRLSAILHPRAGNAPARVLACAAGFSLVIGRWPVRCTRGPVHARGDHTDERDCSEPDGRRACRGCARH